MLGKEGQTYLLKHGGFYIRVHPCRIQLVGDVDNALMVPNYNIQERSALPINSTSSNSPVAANSTRNEVEHTIAANQSEPVSGESSRPVPDLPLNADRSSMVHGPASSVKALPKQNTNIKYKTTQSDVWKM